MPRDSFRPLVAAAAALAVLAGGCGKGPIQQPADRAEAALDQALDAWSRGEPADKFADPGQPIQVTDPDWRAGHRLLSFLTVESKPNPERPGHLRCRVALALQDPRGKRAEREVVYDVQLGQTVVIGRE